MEKKSDGTVISFTKARNARIEELRRKYERVLFKQVLGAYAVAEGTGLKAIELVDLSLDGLSFQLPAHSKNLDAVETGKELVFRLYFTQDSYLPVGVKIMNRRDCIENGQTFVRFGCAIDTSLQSYETYKTFVTFLGKYAETCHQDAGDLKFFFF